MNYQLKPDFVERRVSSMPDVPSAWNVGPGFYYQLSLKMCQIQKLIYAFEWGNKHPGTATQAVLEEPQRILSLDLSLNDLTSLEHQGLAPFTNLRVLNATLNRIDRYVGIEVLKKLCSLNLSHNCISQLQGLDGCKALIHLNLGMNDIRDISYMPSLNHLAELHLYNNSLTSLDGVQALGSLKELHVQRNKLRDIIPLSSNFSLKLLNASDNNIMSFNMTVEVLQGLTKLYTLNLHGNPIERDNNYQSKIIQSTTVAVLDNVNVRSQPKMENLTKRAPDSMTGIKDITQQAFYEHLADKKQNMEETVKFLQRRIIAVQDEYKDYEVKMLGDLDACLRNLECLTYEEAQKYSHEVTRNARPQALSGGIPLPALPQKPNNAPAPRRPEGVATDTQRHKPDYASVRQTDEVLRCAYNELIKTDKE